MPRIPWNPRNYSYGAGSNLGPAALGLLQNGHGYVGSDGKVHLNEKGRRAEREREQGRKEQGFNW